MLEKFKNRLALACSTNSRETQVDEERMHAVERQRVPLRTRRPSNWGTAVRRSQSSHVLGDSALGSVACVFSAWTYLKSPTRLGAWGCLVVWATTTARILSPLAN